MSEPSSNNLTPPNTPLPSKVESESLLQQSPIPGQTKRRSVGHWVSFAMRGGLQLIMMAGVLIGAAFLMNQLAEQRQERPQRAKTEAVFTVATMPLKKADHQPTIEIFGELVPRRTLNLTSQVNGTVIEVNDKLKMGAMVDAGETLMRLDPDPFEITLAEARANLKEAKAAVLETRTRITLEQTVLERAREQMALADADFARARELLSRGAITQRVMEERELTISERRAAVQAGAANVQIQQAQLEAREAAVARFDALVKRALSDLEKTHLKAPFNAVVQSVDVEIGQTITSALPIISLYEGDTLDVRFVLSDGQYGRLLSEGTPFVGRILSVVWKVGGASLTIPAQIDRVGAEIAADQGGITVFATLDSQALANGIRPGAFVNVSVPDRAFNETFRLPETALFEGGTLYVVNDENRLQARKVRVLAYDRQSIIVEGDLEPNDEVIITQIAEVGEGVLIRREDEPSKRKNSPQARAPEQNG